MFLYADKILIERGHESSEEIQNRERVRIDRFVNVGEGSVDFPKRRRACRRILHRDQVFVFRNAEFLGKDLVDFVRRFDFVDFREYFFHLLRVEAFAGNDGFGSAYGNEVAFDHRLQKSEAFVFFESRNEFFLVLPKPEGFGDFRFFFGFAFFLGALFDFRGRFDGDFLSFGF